MKHLVNIPNQDIVNELSSLKTSVDKARDLALRKRLIREPYFTDLEYLLGAFLEMYEPHLQDIVFRLSERGYAIDASSGFSGTYCESQSLNGNFLVDYVTRNKLEKLGIKFREFNGFKSLIFWPDTTVLNRIKTKWLQIVEVLPDKGILDTPSISSEAIAFRMKYIPKDKNLQKKRLFERLKYNIQKRTSLDLKKREQKKPDPDKVEYSLGAFLEEFEIQAREAVLNLHKKGYSIDFSGFCSDPRNQMIEGDFQLEENVIEGLREVGVDVETNASGYTRLQFSPVEAAMKKIKQQWKQVVSILPNKKERAAPSMTRKARDFRLNYSN